MRTHLTLVVAMSRNMCIGRNGNLPWHLRDDLRRFRATTLGHAVIMGRKTWDSLPNKPLPGRKNVVLTRGDDISGAWTARGMAEALTLAGDEKQVECFAIGGAGIYAIALPLASRILVTRVDCVVSDGDAWFPNWDLSEWELLDSEDAPKVEGQPDAIYECYRRRPHVSEAATI